MAKTLQPIVGLDVGTTQTRALMAGFTPEQGRLELLGASSVPSKGVRKGVVVNIEAAEECIRQAISEAEHMAGLEAEQVHVGLSGAHMKGHNGRGVVAIARRNREISVADIRRVIDQASAVSIPSDREIVEVLPQEFVVDDQDGIGDPLGMLGMRLEVAVHIVTSPITAKQNIVTSVNRSGMIVGDLTLESLAAAEATLTEEEREYGVALIDIGGEITSLAIFQRGAVRHTTVIPLGGNHFTNDIAVGLRAPIPEAERIKRNFGCSFGPLLDSCERETMLEVVNVGGRAARTLSRQLLCDMLQPRAEELFCQIQEEIHRSGYERQLSSGLVLTGGGSLLPGIPEVAERLLDMPIRLGIPHGIDGIVDEIASPEFAVVVGLVLHGARHRSQSTRTGRGTGSLRQRSARLREWFSEFKKIF
ncbi:MAG: cell division protein FtsA [Blastocatellia bacterium]|nr:cell division protein FtsA [Blastocatellia bacterium]